MSCCIMIVDVLSISCWSLLLSGVKLHTVLDGQVRHASVFGAELRPAFYSHSTTRLEAAAATAGRPVLTFLATRAISIAIASNAHSKPP